jgi:dimethylamine monooxygenase subunit A
VNVNEYVRLYPVGLGDEPQAGAGVPAGPAPAWLDELAPVTGPPFHRMGTRSSGAGWLTAEAGDAALLAEKARVLRGHHDEAVAALPGTEEASEALLRAVTSWRAAHPLDGPAPAFPAPAGAPAHPVDAAGRLVAEDLCLLVPAVDGGPGWRLGAASLCFPSHWRLADKLGAPVAAVHGPVPHYADELAARVDTFLDRLAPGRGAWRRNWTVHASPALFVPDAPGPPDPPVTVRDAGARLWLRSERQALWRLPAPGPPAIVFSIRTQQVPLAAVAARPALCRALAEAADHWPPDLLAYRGGEAIRAPFTGWLRAAAAGGAGGSRR